MTISSFLAHTKHHANIQAFSTVHMAWGNYPMYYTFKHRLDNFWLNKEVIYNYKADLVGTANRSIIN